MSNSYTYNKGKYSEVTSIYVKFETRKIAPSITLTNPPGEVMLVYKDDLSGIDWDAVNDAILNTASVTPDDFDGTLEVQYRKEVVGQEVWEKISGLTSYGAVEAGKEYMIRVYYDAGLFNNTYKSASSEPIQVKFTERGTYEAPDLTKTEFTANGNQSPISSQISNAIKEAVGNFKENECGQISYTVPNSLGEQKFTVSWAGTPKVKDGSTEYTIVVADSRPDATVTLTGTYAVNGYKDVAEQLKEQIETELASKDLGTVIVDAAGAQIGDANTVKVSWTGSDTYQAGEATFNNITVTDSRDVYEPTYVISRFEVTDYGTEVTAQIKATVEEEFGKTALGAKVEVSVDGKNATVTVSWDGNETYKPGSKVYRVEVVDNRTAITLSGSTASVDLVFNDDGTLNETASKAAAVEAVKKLVPEQYQDGVSIEGSVSGEGTADFTVKRNGNNTVMDLNATVAVTFTDARVETAIVLKDGKTAFDVMQNGYTKVYGATGAEDLNDAIWATAVDAENTSGVVTKDYMTVNGNNVTIEFKGNAEKKPMTASFTYQVVDSRAVVSLAENPKATLGFNEDGSTNYDMTAENISKAVFGEQITLGYGNMTFESSVTAFNKEYPKFVELKGENVKIPVVGTVGYPAISDGPQKLHFTFDGDKNYQGFTDKEVIVTMKDREPSSITLDENAYVVSVGKNPSTDDIKAAIINQVVKEVTPEVARESLTVQYNANPLGDTIQIWKELDGIPMQEEVQIKISWNGNRDYKGCETEPKEIILDNRLATRIVLNEGQSVVYEYYNDEYAALEQSVLNAVLNTAETTVPMPAEPALSIKYKAAVELKAGETTINIDEVVNSINKLLPEGSKIDKDTILNGLDTAWVDFKGGEATITTEDLGALNDIINALPVGKDWIREKIDQILGGIDLSKVASYPAITAGEQEVKVSYAGNSEYCPSSATVRVIIEKAPAKVTVNSKTVYVDEDIQPMYSAVRTDNGRNVDVEAYVVYAGLSANVTLDLYLQIPESAKKTLSYKAAETALKAVGIDLNGTITLGDLFGRLGSWEKVADLLKKLGIGDQILEQISNAIGGIGGSDSEILQKAVEALKNGLNGVVDSGVLENVTITINGDPKGKAGVYGVAAFLSDQNYKPEKDWKIMSAGYLVIKLHTIDVTVGNAKIKPEEKLPEGFVTTEPEDAQVITIYAGTDSSITTSVWLELPGGRTLSAGTVGELKKLLAEQPGEALGQLGIDSSVLNAMLTAVAGLPGGELDNVHVYYGVPNEVPGVYAVTAIASKPGYGLGVGAGSLVVELAEAPAIDVKDDAVCYVDEKIPDDLVTYTPDTAKVITMYAGVTSNVTTGVWLTVPGVSSLSAKTLGELKGLLETKPERAVEILKSLGVEANEKLVTLLLEQLNKLPGTALDDVPVVLGTPVGQAGFYTVTAAALLPNALPAVDAGTLTIKLRDDLKVTVEKNRVVELTEATNEEDVFNGLVKVESEGDGEVRTLVLYAGMSIEGGKLYIEGLNGGPDTMTLEELRQRLAGNETLKSEYKLILAAIEKLPESEAGKWTVTTGKPPVAAGTYTVIAGAVKEGCMPAVDMGQLTIVDKGLTWIRYVAAEGGTVSPERELVTSTNTLTGSTATPKEGYHFVKWTKSGIVVEEVSTAAHYTPGKPSSILDVRDMRYTAHFERHTWQADDAGTVTKAATCTEDGVLTLKCTQCDATTTRVIPATGHQWDEGVVTTEPTCTEKGVKTYTCSVCNETKTEEVAELGHTMEEVPGVAMSCITNKPGKTAHWQCSVCLGLFADQIGNTVWTEENGTIPVQHTVSTSSIIPEVPATCLGTGTLAHWHCAVCGKDFSDSACTMELTELTIPAKGHTEVEIPAVPATCTTDGTTAGVKCSVCQTIIQQPEVAPATGHDWVTDQTVESTSCPGTTVHYQHCGNPNCTATRTLADSPVGHTPADSDYVAPTCTTDGHANGTNCSRCGAVIEEQERIPALGHSYEDVVMSPTCTENGYTTHTCSRPGCGHSYRDEQTNQLGHSFSNYKTTSAATCTENAKETGTCERCSVTDTREIAGTATGHTEMTDAAVAATCTEAGKTEGKHCSVCNTVIVEQTEVAALGHNYNTNVVTVQPGAYTTGVRTYICANDPSHTYTEVIPATGGEYDPGINITPPTITTPTVTPGGGTTAIPDTQVPQSGGTSDDTADIEDLDVPLAMMPALNSTDHFAYIKGYEDGSVRPKDNITRAEVASIFFRLLTDAYRDSVYAVSHSFTDAPADQWYNEAIATIANAGLLKGYEDGTVRPNRNITRAEFVTIAANFLMDEGDGEVSFTDIQGHWAEDDIKRVAAAGWIMGDGDGSFRPNDSVTRAEVVTVINRILGRATKAAEVEMMDGVSVWPDCTPSDWWYVAVQEATNGHEYESGETERWTALL